MGPLKAHVQNGRLVLDEPTDLPDGEVVYLERVPAMASDSDQLSDDERADLERELEASLAEADAGETEDFAAVLSELRAR